MLDWLFGAASGTRFTAVDLQGRLEQADAPFLLDVREPSEFAEGRVKGALLMPLGQVPQQWQTLPKDREIAVICRSGARSGRAAAFLKQQGLNAVNVEGGMLAWQGPVERG